MSQDLELFELYFQKNKDYYIERLARFNEGQKFTFNVFAFFFGIFWFIYRKMYLQAVIITFLLFAEAFLEEIMLDDFEYKTEKFIEILFPIILAGVIGSIGNYLYLNKAKKIIQRSTARYNGDELRKIIKRKGGVSYSFLVVLAIAIVLFFLYNNYFANSDN